MRHLLRILPVCAVFILSGCVDKKRVDKLDSEIRSLKSDTRDEIDALRDRLDAYESNADGSPNEERFVELENRITRLLEKNDDRSKMAYLSSNNTNGHATIQTDHGAMLVRLEGIDLNVGGQGFNVHLSIGNPTGVSIQQFLLKGDYGSGVPVLSPGQNYSLYNKQIDSWQKTLTPFEVLVTKPLKPMAWTQVDVILDARSRDDLDLMRFGMVIQNAHLEGINVAGGSGDTHAHISIDSNSAGVLKTDYGAFLIVARDSQSAGVGTRVKIDIGNPYGFAINQCRLVGDFGQPLPKRKVGETQAKFLNRLDEWTASLKPFSAQIDSKVSSFRWNEASILIPGPPSEVKFLRAQLRIENVTLPHVKEK